MRLRSLDDILAKFREVLHRHRRRYLQRNLRPCPNNCKMAEIGTGHRVLGCEGCGSTNPDRCYDADSFVPIMSKEDVFQQFREELRDPATLLRDYRDVVFFMWVLNIPVEVDQKLDTTLLDRMEKPEEKPVKPSPTVTTKRVDGNR